MGEGLSRSASSLSVVVVAYHSGAGLARCLKALREEAPEAEVVVVDNGGAEDEIGDERRDGVRIVAPGENVGFAEGANRGAAESSGDVLVFLNPDTVVARGALQQLARTLERPEIGVAMARLRLLDQPGLLNSGGTVVHVSGLVWAGRFGEPAEVITAVEDVAAASGAALAIRRSTFQELGGFTGELFMYHEDVELSWRAHLYGLRVVVDPGADALHEYEFGRNPTKLALLERNRLIFVLTAHSARQLLVLSPLLVGGELALLALAARNGWLRGKVGGWWWLAVHARWIARHRRETQGLRRVKDSELAKFLSPALNPRMVPVPRGTTALNRLLSSYWSFARRML